MTGFLLAVCITCAGDLSTDKFPTSCQVEVWYADDWGSALETATSAGYTSAYLLDEEDGIWLRRSGGPSWCELED